MILRTYKGNRKSVGKQQVGSQTLLAAVRSLGNDFPILKEARREVLEDLMDAPHAREVLAKIESGAISIEEKFLDFPSPFSFSIVLQGYSDVLRVEDRQLFLQRMHENVLARLAGKNVPASAMTDAAEELREKNDGFTYEEHWAHEEKTKEVTVADRKLVLKQQLYRAARKAKLTPEIVIEASRLIEGERKGFSDAFIVWLQGLLQGVIPKDYEDELVKFLFEAISEVQQ